MLVLRETWHAHIECQDVHAKFFFGIFWYPKMFFRVVGAYAPMFQKYFSYFVFLYWFFIMFRKGFVMQAHKLTYMYVWFVKYSHHVAKEWSHSDNNITTSREQMSFLES